MRQRCDGYGVGKGIIWQAVLCLLVRSKSSFGGNRKGSQQLGESNSRTRCNVVGCGGRLVTYRVWPPRHPIGELRKSARGIGWLLICRVTRSQWVNFTPSIKSADHEVIVYMPLDNGSVTTFIDSDELGRLDIQRRSYLLTTIDVSGTARIKPVRSAFRVLSINWEESVNIKSTVSANEVPTMEPIWKVFERIVHWLQ